MTTVAEVRLWGKTIGAVSLADGEQVASFEYAGDFVRSGIEAAPLMMPLAERVYRFPNLNPETFYGLPGLLADALPDTFGNLLIDQWLASQGRDASSFNAVERLCYTGRRAMGALEFAPVKGPRARKAGKVQIDALVELASDILSNRNNMHGSFDDKERQQALTQILRVGTSAGGARAKAVIAWNPATNEVRSGQVPADPGFEHWLLKFDGVRGNRDRELDDPQGYGAIEYAYFRIARACGIEINDCRLLEENGRRHFMTRRFDRVDGRKLHMQSLGALAHYDMNATPGSYSYEQAFLVMRRLGLPMAATEQLFRRMVFNVVGRNQDDHVKNIAFLMDKAGNWSLAPAFDMTYAYNPQGAWTARQQMSLNGKQDDFTRADFRAVAETALMKRGRADTLLDEVIAAFADWPRHAEAAGVLPRWRQAVQGALRLEFMGSE